jgi:epoxyqueuosine reductase
MRLEEVIYDSREATARIREKALQLGFSACGIAKVRPLTEDSDYLQAWFREGYQGKMSYLANYAEKRNDPSLLVPEAKSVIVVLLNYNTGKKPASTTFKAAKYALGNDYHFVVRQFLGQLHRFICDEIAPVQGRAFCDSAPVFERRWAQEAGLGMIGLNRSLIHPQFGSFCFIGELMVDLELEYDTPLAGNCGNCGQCVKVCPTGALRSDGILEAEKCVSYLTLELKDDIPEALRNKLGGSIVGCDRCQDVCPWNTQSSQYASPLWQTDPELMSMKDADWMTLDRQQFKAKFADSALSRLGYDKLRQNCRCAIDSARHYKTEK